MTVWLFIILAVIAALLLSFVVAERLSRRLGSDYLRRRKGAACPGQPEDQRDPG